MYTKRKTKKKSLTQRFALSAPLVLIGLSGSSFGFLHPSHSISSQHSQNARVFTEGLKIELDRSSPAFAALEDSWISDRDLETIGQDTDPSRKPVPSVTLSAGVASLETQILRIQKDNRREIDLIAQERAMKEAQAKAFAQAAAEAIRRMALKNKADARAAMVESKMAREEDLKLPPINHPTKTISLTDLRMSREELVGSLLFPIAASDAPARQNHQEPTLIARNLDQKARLGGLAARIRRPEAFEGTVGEQALTGRAEPLRQVIVSGAIEFTDGLALANALDQLIVFREHEGEIFESGRVWLREGRYEIFLEETQGHLISELRTPYGDILGKGEIDLSRVKIKDPATNRLDAVNIQVRPVMPGMSGVVVGYNKPPQEVTPLNGVDIQFNETSFEARSKKDGTYNQTFFLEGSTAIVRVNRPGYWGTMAIAQAGVERELNLLPNQPGQLMHDLIVHSKTDTFKTTTSAIIWGKVTRKGQPVAGAQVDLMTTERPIRPIYFNSAMLPDPTLRETSANGLYAFFPVPEGAHAVQAVIEDNQSEPIIFPAGPQMASRIDLETSAEARAKIKVFDAFRTDWPLAASITDPGFTRSLEVSRRGEAELNFVRGDGIMILDVDAGRHYERIRLTLGRDRRMIYAPMVQSMWLENLKSSIRANKMPESGTVVGFVQGSSAYRVAIHENKIGEKPKVLYFNSRGEVTGREYGEPGGGFVLLNVPEGFKTIVIQPNGTQRVFTSLVLVDSKVTGVVNHRIR